MIGMIVSDRIKAAPFEASGPWPEQGQPEGLAPGAEDLERYEGGEA
ncbi:hypothetical protein OCH239_19890 [Roseivivax halodurans JCM 10272]|uniref:Uncharacterized protein n=1 Tax=Roseivivax halodurans JCM 10272 TaxID=1449350 RepID=X7EG65_9RHOB|nr:hypothetical protein [Roseivivax halodurans]ETX15084.1 hypothetical protein OCH239_19890 [Roseivivax halodurans JCM 10272]